MLDTSMHADTLVGASFFFLPLAFDCFVELALRDPDRDMVDVVAWALVRANCGRLTHNLGVTLLAALSFNGFVCQQDVLGCDVWLLTTAKTLGGDVAEGLLLCDG